MGKDPLSIKWKEGAIRWTKSVEAHNYYQWRLIITIRRKSSRRRDTLNLSFLEKAFSVGYIWWHSLSCLIGTKHNRFWQKRLNQTWTAARYNETRLLNLSTNVGNIDLNWSCKLARGQLLNTDLIMQVLSILALSAYPM